MFYNLWAKFRIRERWRQEDGWDFWLVQVAAGEYSSALNLYSNYTNFISLFLKHTDFECRVGFSLQSIKFRYDSSIMTLLCTNNCIKLRTSTGFVCTNNLNIKCTRWSEPKWIWNFKASFGSSKCREGMHDDFGVFRIRCNLFTIDSTWMWKNVNGIVWSCLEKVMDNKSMGNIPSIPVSVSLIPFTIFHIICIQSGYFSHCIVMTLLNIVEFSSMQFTWLHQRFVHFIW